MYNADWTHHANSYSSKRLTSAYTKLVIRNSGDGQLIFDWFLRLEPNDDKQEIYDLGEWGTVTCDEYTLSLQLPAIQGQGIQ